MKRTLKRIVSRLKKRALRNVVKGKGHRAYQDRLKARCLEALAS
jgi:hypothetical protein